MDKTIKKYNTLKKVGQVLSSTSTPVLVVSLLSPFDFEGPLIEIISSIVVTTGLIITKTANDKLNILNEDISEENITNNEYNKEDKINIQTNTKSLNKSKIKKRILKKENNYSK